MPETTRMVMAFLNFDRWNCPSSGKERSEGDAAPPSPIWVLRRPAARRQGHFMQEGGLRIHRWRAYHNLRCTKALHRRVRRLHRTLAAQLREPFAVDGADCECDAEVDHGG